MSPDPTGIFLGNLNDPQSLNLYAYVRNNPVGLTDPTGLEPQDAGSGCTWDPDTNFSGTLNCSSESSGYVDCIFQPVFLTCGSINPGRFTDNNPYLPRHLPRLRPSPAPQKQPKERNLCAKDSRNPSKPFFGALEFRVKLGPEAGIDLGPLAAEVGTSFFKNLTSGEFGATADIQIGPFGISAERKSPEGTVYGGETEIIASAWRGQYNLTTGEKNLDLSKTFKFGAQAIVGVEVSLDPTKSKILNREYQACK